MDLGAGDGRSVLAHAAAHPERLVLGVDASHDAMREASRRASRAPARGGRPNALFVASALEQLPGGLDGLADLVTVHFPWGTLRAAAAAHDRDLTARLARLVQPGGTIQLLLADADRDGTPPVDIEALEDVYRCLGLQTVVVQPATLADAVAAHSSWGKRLLRHSAPGRSAWQIMLERPAARPATRG
jgi:16S rRNA (adenine(1408)-N(1))-methyltransferase